MSKISKSFIINRVLVLKIYLLLLIILQFIYPFPPHLLTVSSVLANGSGHPKLTRTNQVLQDPDPLPAVYLPLLAHRLYQEQQAGFPVINIPFFESEILPEQSAVFWFGQVTPTDNYADVRIGYSSEKLWVRVSIFDRRLWYNNEPSPADFSQWDAVSLYLDTSAGSSPEMGSVYRLDAQLNQWEPRQNYQAAYTGSSLGWIEEALPFTAQTRWYGFPQPNDNRDDRAWWVAYSIPFQSLGLTVAPAEGSRWRLAVQVHDRDDLNDAPESDQLWPDWIVPDLPASWGHMNFGLPGYTPPQVEATHLVSIRNGLNGIDVPDGVVGGNTECGWPVTDFFTEWGNRIYVNEQDVNIQNQGNTDDWPCFSKYYITFPLDSLPPDKVVISASLTLHQTGQSTGFDEDPPKALNSLIQVFQIGEDWSTGTISWNTGPLPLENISQAWVGPITMAEHGIARVWDVSRVVDRAYTAGESLQLALYSADYYGPNGKYFFSSSSTDWAGAMRPQLDVTLGDP